MRLPPLRLLRRWASKGLIEPPDRSTHAQPGPSRRALVGMLVSALAVSQVPVDKAAANAWLRVLPPGGFLIPTVKTGGSWNGTATPSSYVQSNDLLHVAGDPVLWDKVPVTNSDMPDLMPIDAPTAAAPNSNIVCVTFSTGDPNGRWCKEIVVIVENGAPVTIPGSAMRVSPNTGVPGYLFRIAHDQGVYGNATVTIIARPYNGREKVITRTFLLDNFNLRPIRYLDGSAASEGDGSAGAPWKTFSNAQVQAPEGAIVVTAKSDYREAAALFASNTRYGNSPASVKNAVNMMTTFRIAAGLNVGDVKIGLLPALGRGEFFFRNGKLLLKGFYTDFTNMTTLNGAYNGSSQANQAYKPTVWFQGGKQWDDQGPNGVKYDPSNNITDPDENPAIGTQGGFGFYADGSVYMKDPSTPFYTGNGERWGMLDCVSQLISLRGASTSLYFERNHKATVGYDAVIVGGGTTRGLVKADGYSPAYDTQGMALLMSDHYAPVPTALKSRLHVKPTVRIASITSYAGTQTLGWSYLNGGVQTANSVKSTIGFCRVTFGAQVDNSSPTFKPAIPTNIIPENVLRFMTDMVGVRVQDAYPSATKITYGWQVIACGTQPYDLTIGGTAISPPLQPNEAIICGDLGGTAAKQGTLATLFGPLHTDSMQWNSPGANDPNHDDVTFLGYRAWGLGFGNLMLFQADANNSLTGTISVGTDGTFTISGIAKSFLGDSIFANDSGTYLAQKGMTSLIATINPDGVSGTLNRPFYASDGVTPIQVTNMPIIKKKSIRNVAVVNCMLAVNNQAQFGGGQENIHFLHSTILAINGLGGAPSPAFNQRGPATNGFVIRESIVYNPTTSCLNSASIDADPAYTVINSILTGSSGLKSSWFANDNGGSSTAVTSMSIVTPSDPTQFPLISGMPARRSLAPVMPFDIAGNLRVPGVSLIGALAA